MKINWKAILYAILSGLCGLLGGAGYEKFTAPTPPAPAAYEATTDIPAVPDITRTAVYDLELYWERQENPFPGGDIFYHRIQAPIKGAPTLENIKASNLKPPFSDAELKSVYAARFVRYLPVQPAPNPPKDIEDRPAEEE